MHPPRCHRRRFLAGAGAFLALASAAGKAHAASAIPAGIYPIAWTPCTPDNVLDLAAMAAQTAFCDRGHVAGLVWPQNASAWNTLSDREWQDGVTTLLAARKRTGIVIGVQTVDGDTAKSVARAKFAAAHGADAIISLPPGNAPVAPVLDYYKAVGAATPLPLMMQAVGDVSVELITTLSKEVPTLAAVKDEAGDPLQRAPRILADTKLQDFSGGGGRNLLTEMVLGFSGSCPYVGLADLFQRSFDLWRRGERAQAFDMFGRILAFNSIPGANDYVLTARGVFAEDVVLRKLDNAPPSRPPDAARKQMIREALDRYLKPYLPA
ncbi:MAG TPA: dihydrodipicolinate synthase family protein [Rhizomicrobium sp.]